MLYIACTLSIMRKNSTQSHNYLVLTSTEDRVLRFLTSQQHGASISNISQAISLARTSIYNSVRSLIKKNLVIKEGYAYMTTSDKWQPYVDNIKTPKEHIKALTREMLGLKQGEIIYSIESDEEIRELFKSRKELLFWQNAVAEKGIVLKGVGTKKALSFFQSMLDSSLHKAIMKRSGSPRLTGDTIQGPCVLVSFQTSVIFFSRSKNFFYRIDNAYVAHFSQSVIDLLYNALEHQPIVSQ